MKLSALVAYLLSNRHHLTGDTIADCLDLAIIVSADPTRRIQWDELARRWGVNCRVAVSRRVIRLQDAGLAEYDSGVCHQPGYLFLRVGPSEPCQK